MTKKRIYKDLDLNFLAHPNTGDVSRVVNANAVIKAYRHLVLTNFYEAPFQPNKGNWLAGALFENDSNFTQLIIKQEILSLAENWEPRVSDVVVEIEAGTNSYEVSISFKVIGLLEPVTFTVILERTR